MTTNEPNDHPGPLRIETGDSAIGRAFLIAVGAGVIALVIYELGRGVWPFNIFSPFFLFMILGACTVGGPTILGGLFGWAATWEVAPGLITILLKSPFRQRILRLSEREILGLGTIEKEAMEGDNTWCVELTTSTERFQTRDFSSRKAADEMRRLIDEAFRRKP